MKAKIILSIFFIWALILLLTYYKKNERYETYTNREKKIRNEIKDLFNITEIKNIPYTLSIGLLIDCVILYNSISNKEKLYDIYYEEYIKINDPKKSYFFVNLDITNFNRLLEDKSSPYNILCKTKQTYDILKSKIKNKNIIYTGFTSLDRYNPHVKKDYKSFIHNVGKSPYKGTKNILNIWRKNTNFPTLTIICRNKEILSDKDVSNIKNIKLISHKLSEKELEYQINKNGIHICPSNHEGFGHYINEASSAKSVVLYTNSPPMNEFYGIPIPINDKINKVTNNGWCPFYEIDEYELEEIIKNILANKYNTEEIGNNARKKYLLNDFNFKNRIKNIFI